MNVSNYGETMLSEKLEMLAQLAVERCCTGKWEIRVSAPNVLSKIDENIRRLSCSVCVPKVISSGWCGEETWEQSGHGYPYRCPSVGDVMGKRGENFGVNYRQRNVEFIRPARYGTRAFPRVFH